MLCKTVISVLQGNSHHSSACSVPPHVAALRGEPASVPRRALNCPLSTSFRLLSSFGCPQPHGWPEGNRQFTICTSPHLQRKGPTCWYFTTNGEKPCESPLGGLTGPGMQQRGNGPPGARQPAIARPDGGVRAQVRVEADSGVAGDGTTGLPWPRPESTMTPRCTLFAPAHVGLAVVCRSGRHSLRWCCSLFF